MKFSGYVGFWEGDEEVKKGVYKPKIVEKHYVGDVRQIYNRNSGSDFQNDDFKINNQISIISDLYARENFMSIKYVIWKEKALKVNTVDLNNYPRLNLEIGGIYNGQRSRTTT